MEVGYIRLMNWFSPAFPVGGFAWSSGLESACQSGAVRDKNTLHDWITTGLECGIWRNDAIFLTAAFRGNEDIFALNDLALSMAGSKERFEETTNQGDAFLAAADPWRAEKTPILPKPISYPVAVGVIASQSSLLLENTLQAFLNAMASNQIQAALRLIKLGQASGVELLKDLEIPLYNSTQIALGSDLSDLGSHAIMMDTFAMQHETLASRIFRS